MIFNKFKSPEYFKNGIDIPRYYSTLYNKYSAFWQLINLWLLTCLLLDIVYISEGQKI